MKKENEIPIGTRVMLNPTSRWVTSDSHQKNSSNPLNIEGTIDDYDGFSYDVEWDNKTHNSSYKIGEDLIILGDNLNQEFYY